MFDLGVKLNLNTDDPQIFNINLNDEYENALKQWGFDKEDFVQMNRLALEASFLDKNLKDKLAKYFT